MAFLAGQKASAAAVNAAVLGDYREGACSTDTTVTTSVADLPGASVTITTPVANTKVKITAILDINSTGNTDLPFATCAVDGTELTGNCKWQVAGRGMPSQVWLATLPAAGSHTIKLRTQKVGTTNTVTVYAVHSKVVVEGKGIA